MRRNFHINYVYARVPKAQEVSFRFIGYELPFQGLLYVRLGQRWWMNASAGISLDMYPSNVLSQITVSSDTTFYIFAQKTYRTRWIQVAALANYGFEYRSRKDGYFYVGASYHRPFQPIGYTRAGVESKVENVIGGFDLIGTYLTLDLRYFFPEPPERPKPK